MADRDPPAAGARSLQHRHPGRLHLLRGDPSGSRRARDERLQRRAVGAPRPKVGVSSSGSLIPRFRRARRDPSLAVLEGFHALKHALRFDARLIEIVASEDAALERLADALAPDLSARLLALARPVGPAVFAQLAPLPPSTGVIAPGRAAPGRPRRGARRPARGARGPARGPTRSRQHGRLRPRRRRRRCRRRAQHRQPRPLASRRFAGRRGTALRPTRRAPGAAGDPGGLDRPLLAIDPEGEPLAPAALPPRAVLAFGTERYGLSRRAHRPRRHADQHPHAARGLQPQPGDLGGRRSVRLAARRARRVRLRRLGAPTPRSLPRR